jgi:hypothetical protein
MCVYFLRLLDFFQYHMFNIGVKIRGNWEISMEEDYFPRRSPTLLQGGHVGFVFSFFGG